MGEPVSEVDAPIETNELLDLGGDVDLFDPDGVTTEERVGAAVQLAEQERVRRAAAAREGRQALDRALQAMQQGQVVEQGTHRELLERDGVYRYLYNLQFQS